MYYDEKLVFSHVLIGENDDLPLFKRRYGFTRACIGWLEFMGESGWVMFQFISRKDGKKPIVLVAFGALSFGLL